MYLYSVLPSLFSPLHSTFECPYTPSGILAKFSTLPTHQLKDPFPGALRFATLELASTNLICSVALTGVLALQAGRFWAESSDTDDEDFEVETEGLRSRAKTPDPRTEKRNTVSS